MTKYSKQYFIEKFEAIKEEDFIIGVLKSKNNPERKCALGHCNVTYIPIEDEDYLREYNLTEEAKALILLFGGKDENDWPVVTKVNDETFKISPKFSILEKLKSLPD